MSVLALASTEELAARWPATVPGFRRLRGPEVGLVMVRAQAGGTGLRFNLGEITVTRCAVQLADGTVGHACVGGRRPEHAERAAVLDALLQQPGGRAELEAAIVAPLEQAQALRRQGAVARSASSRVEFLTMVRGED
jgi:alpha-D-ribose 1-methylphosphonate 5-triphosphate synthase subunit PhnG